MIAAIQINSGAYVPVGSYARPSSIGPNVPAAPTAIQMKPYSVEIDRRPKWRPRRYGAMSNSPPAPIPMSTAATRPCTNVCASANRSMPAAAIVSSAHATRAAAKRSMSHPASSRPARLLAASVDTTNAARAGRTPRSVSSAARWTPAPVVATVLPNTTIVRVQKTRDPRARRTAPRGAPGAAPPQRQWTLAHQQRDDRHADGDRHRPQRQPGHTPSGGADQGLRERRQHGPRHARACQRQRERAAAVAVEPAE